MQLYLPNLCSFMDVAEDWGFEFLLCFLLLVFVLNDLPFMYTLYKQAQTCLRFHLQIFIITFPGGNLSNYHCYYYYFTAIFFSFYLINFLANYFVWHVVAGVEPTQYHCFVDRLLERVCHLWCELTSESIFYDNRRTSIFYCDYSPSASLVKWFVANIQQDSTAKSNAF